MTIYQTAAQMTGRPFNNKIAILGDSRTDQCTSSTSLRSAGWLHHLKALVWQRIEFRFDLSQTPVSDNFGVSGQRSDQILARVDDMLAATDASVIIAYGCSVNDRLQGRDWETFTLPNLRSIQSKIIDAGRIIIWVTDTLSGDATFASFRLTGAQLRYHQRTRQWMLDQVTEPGVYVADPRQHWDLATSLVGYNKLLYTLDGLHPISLGAYWLAKSTQPIIEALFPPRAILPTSNSDQYHATDNPKGCLNSNPLLDGTSGTLNNGGGTNCSGVLATGYTCTAGADATGTTAVYSKETDGRQKVVLAGTTSAGTASNQYEIIKTINLVPLLSAGDIIEAVLDLDIAEGMANIWQLGLNIQAQGGVTINSWDGIALTTEGPLPGNARRLIYRTPRVQIPVGTTTLYARLVASLIPSTTVAATLTMGAISVRKVG